mmetsp:Transcript_18216/g.25662  ORF Transcript_18216/g.25662 Transcript_18216/m.25662 type:complete len:282 (+) Transcript_18216:309-1154(+)
MPRGTNYANSDKDQHTVAADPIKKKKKIPGSTQCQYGAGCNRTDCTYKHPNGKAGGKMEGGQSNEPCMPYLAGVCAFPEGACKKRHPPKSEVEKLTAKYKTMKCRFADKCRTKGCLYIHPGEKGADQIIETDPLDFPPLSGEAGSAPSTKSSPPAPMGAWGKAPNTSAPPATASSNRSGGTSTPTSGSSPAKDKSKAEGNSPKSSSATTAATTAWNGKNTNIVTPDYAKALTKKNNNGDAAAASPANTKKTVSPAPAATTTTTTEGILNASAKEFVPKNFS